MAPCCCDSVFRLLSRETLLFLIPFLVFAQGSPNVQFLANFNAYSATGYNDCWGYTDPNGREYALLGVRNGTSIIDITDAPSLREVVFIPGVNSLWKDIKTYRTYAYVVTDQVGKGIQIIDLSMLPDTAYLVNTFAGSDTTSHNISIDTTTGILYAQGGAGIVRVVDLQDPINPVEIPASFENLSQCHDVYAFNHVLYTSEGSAGSVGIYDVTNPAQPALLKRFAIPNAGYVHNAWALLNNALVMTTEETSGKTVKLWQISDLDNIVMTDEILAPEGLAHNTHLKWPYAYISHYKDGLRIINISNPSNISEAGYYDTYNGSLAGNFHGAWGAFPFFDSGKILISDMESGLFVVYFAGGVVSVEDPSVDRRPSRVSLMQNYPNPFNPETTITFELDEQSRVSLRVYDILGREVAVLLDGVRSIGRHFVRFSGEKLPTGLYIYRLESPTRTLSGTMSLIR